MFCMVDLEYPCFDTDLISPPSMTKGKETAVCLHGHVRISSFILCLSCVT